MKEEGVLRQGQITRILILHYIYTHRVATATTIAQSLGLTPQGVYGHIKDLVSSGHIEREREGYRLTQKGLSLMIESTQYLRDIVAEIYDSLRSLDIVECIAMSDIKAGDTVVLEMQDGYLCARPITPTPQKRRERPYGTAAMDVKKGDALTVRNVTGTVEVPKGRIRILVLRDVSEGAVDKGIKPLRSVLKGGNAAYVGAYGTGALAIMKANSMPLNFEFGVPAASVECAVKGLNCDIVTTRSMLTFLITYIERESNFWGTKIDVDVLTIGDDV